MSMPFFPRDVGAKCSREMFARDVRARCYGTHLWQSVVEVTAFKFDDWSIVREEREIVSSTALYKRLRHLSKHSA